MKTLVSETNWGYCVSSILYKSQIFYLRVPDNCMVVPHRLLIGEKNVTLWLRENIRNYCMTYATGTKVSGLHGVMSEDDLISDFNPMVIYFATLGDATLYKFEFR